MTQTTRGLGILLATILIIQSVTPAQAFFFGELKNNLIEKNQTRRENREENREEQQENRQENQVEHKENREKIVSLELLVKLKTLRNG
jgi:hypothetical protein